MPRVIDIADDEVASLPEAIAAIDAAGFDPADEQSLAHTARWLRRLGNNRTFLGDILVEELAQRHREDVYRSSYSPQVVVLSAPHRDFYLRANIWPSVDEHMVRASGTSAFAIGLPHDHNFNFLTLGYFGPGYWSDYFEYDHHEVVGWRGEPVPSLRFVERARLEPGKLMLYRAHIDVHAQLPADALSVSLNVMHSNGAQGWLDQYRFDTQGGCIAAPIGTVPNEAFLKVAVALDGAEALDLAERFAFHHPSDRMRLAAWDALASRHADQASRDALWTRAEASGSRLVEAEARLRRAELAV